MKYAKTNILWYSIIGIVLGAADGALIWWSNGKLAVWIYDSFWFNHVTGYTTLLSMICFMLWGAIVGVIIASLIGLWFRWLRT